MRGPSLVLASPELLFLRREKATSEWKERRGGAADEGSSPEAPTRRGVLLVVLHRRAADETPKATAGVEADAAMTARASKTISAILLEGKRKLSPGFHWKRPTWPVSRPNKSVRPGPRPSSIHTICYF
ncbi:hypothetical protein B296_00006498 [Ensete ventricosum]|uniref:Uncharacterized protein n=1 Tax=Ensete ventricosum TaxID=4639 RepID=A0A426ZMV5_ENSVE|nr:hypothetical protein B296_00006498 [Ensete ventricosum]